MRRFLLVGALFLIVGVALALSISFDASQPPAAGEARIATLLKRWYIARESKGVAAEPPSDLPSINSGQMTYGGDCSSCHGEDGRHPEPLGRSMFPPAPDLGSAGVQRWSDAELFWIIKHGIRLSGMPGFGNIDPDDTIWDVVHYVRSLHNGPQSLSPPQ